MKRPSLMDPSFKYVTAANTNLRERFEEIRREQKEAAKAPAVNVTNLKRKA